MQQLLGRQFGEVFGDMNAGLAELQQFDALVILAGAEDDAQWRLFARLTFVLVEPAQVQGHLAEMIGPKLIELQFNGDKSPETTVEKQQVQVKVVAVHRHSLLPGNEGEARTQFEQKGFHFPQNGGFEVIFLI